MLPIDRMSSPQHSFLEANLIPRVGNIFPRLGYPLDLSNKATPCAPLHRWSLAGK